MLLYFAPAEWIYFAELFEFMEFLEYKNSHKTNGFDIAIAEEKNGDVEVFNSFEAFRVEIVSG